MPQNWTVPQRVPPGMKIDVAIPQDKAEVAVSRLRELAKGLKLKLFVIKSEPDKLQPLSTYYEIAVMAEDFPKNQAEADETNNSLMSFQGLFQTAILVSNTPEEELMKLAKETDPLPKINKENLDD